MLYRCGADEKAGNGVSVTVCQSSARVARGGVEMQCFGHDRVACLLAIATTLAMTIATASSAGGGVIINCPTETDPTYGVAYVCKVENEFSAIEILLADPDQGRDVFAIRSWTVGGVEQLDEYRVMVYDDVLGDFPDFDLTTASRDEGRDQIIVTWEDDPGGAFVLSSNFVLMGSEEFGVSLFVQHFASNFGADRAQRLFVYTDFALEGTSEDEQVSVASPPDGRFITYSERVVCPPAFFGFCVSTVLDLGPIPTAFDVGLSSAFAPLLDYQLPDLQGNLLATGPADLASVQAWNYVGDLSIQKQLSFPVPEPAGGTGAVMLTLVALSRSRRARNARSRATRRLGSR